MWTEIIISVLSGTTLAGIVEAVRFRRETKRLKENEAKQSDVETQKQQIDLAELYKDKMLQMLEQLSEKQDKGSDNQDKIMQRLEKLDKRMEGVEHKVDEIDIYLNGNFKAWQREQTKKASATRKKGGSA